MNESQITNVELEQKLNSEQKPIEPTESNTSAKPLVGCSASLSKDTFNPLVFLGYPPLLIDIVSNDILSLKIKEEFGELSEQYTNRADELQKTLNIQEIKRQVWVKDNPTSKPYLKLLTRQEHYQHYQ